MNHTHEVEIYQRNKPNLWLPCTVIGKRPSPDPNEQFNRFDVTTASGVSYQNIHPDCLRKANH